MGEHTKNKTNKKNKNKRNKNIKYNYIQLWRLKLLQPAAWAIRASIMIALTKTSPPNCNLLGLRIFGKCCYQNNSMLLIALLVETELRQARGLDDRSNIDRHITYVRLVQQSCQCQGRRAGSFLLVLVAHLLNACSWIEACFGHMHSMLFVQHKNALRSI